MGRYQASVAGGLHAGYGGTIQGMDQSWLNLAGAHRIAGQALGHKGEYEFRAITDALVLSGVGGTATKTYPEIAPSPELGGARPVNQTTIINRTVTTGDVSDVRKALTSLSAGTTFGPAPPVNWDRNPLGTR